jgi:DNA processing protein
VTGIEDILHEFEFLIPPPRAAASATRPAIPLTEDEARVVRVLEEGESDVDSLIRAAGLKPAVVNSLLIGMEMKKILRALPGRRVELVRGTGPASPSASA